MADRIQATAQALTWHSSENNDNDKLEDLKAAPYNTATRSTCSIHWRNW